MRRTKPWPSPTFLSTSWPCPDCEAFPLASPYVADFYTSALGSTAVGLLGWWSGCGQENRVVADGEVLVAAGAEIDESLLTNESARITRPAGLHGPSCSGVVVGRGWSRADTVGAESYANQARAFQPAVSQLRQSIGVLKAVTWALVPVAVLLAASQLLAGETVRAPR